jgi:hypothetical protein
VKNFKLAELGMPRRYTFSAQIVDERMLAGSGAHSQQRTQVFIEEVPFLFEAVETTRGFLFDGLFEGEQVFVGEFLGGHDISLL